MCPVLRRRRIDPTEFGSLGRIWAVTSQYLGNSPDVN